MNSYVMLFGSCQLVIWHALASLTAYATSTSGIPKSNNNGGDQQGIW